MKTVFLASLLFALPGLAQAADAPPGPIYEVVVYGGTSAGVAAAEQVRRMGMSVVLVEPTHRPGGLTTGGLGQTDIGNKMVTGGISRESYRRIRRLYEEKPDPVHGARRLLKS